MNKILIIVDLQQDFTHGSLGGDSQRSIIPNVVAKVKNAMKDDIPIVFTLDTHHFKTYKNCREGKHLPIEHCIWNTEGWKLISELGELRYEKTEVLSKVNSFGLNNNQIRCLIEIAQKYNCDEYVEFEICGLVTNMCVLAVAQSIQNNFPNAEITINASCCASFDPNLHEKALDIMEGLQMNVINR